MSKKTYLLPPFFLALVLSVFTPVFADSHEAKMNSETATSEVSKTEEDKADGDTQKKKGDKEEPDCE